jgi:hypothetical protein
MPTLNKHVYYVTCLTDNTVLVAIDLRTDKEYVRWFDSTKERMMKIGKILEQTKDKFVFERDTNDKGGIYTFQPLTLDAYHQQVMSQLHGGHQVKSIDEVYDGIAQARDSNW